MKQIPRQLLIWLNTEYTSLHRGFENFFWLFNMGNYDVGDAMNEAEAARDAFRSDPRNLAMIKKALAMSGLTNNERGKLNIWEQFFGVYQIPRELTRLREKISVLENDVARKLATKREGYTDPAAGRFIEASKNKMRMLMRTSLDEALRKACFDSLEKMSTETAGDYVKLVAMRNEFARALGFEDFYAYKLSVSEKMTKDDVFNIFDEVYQKTKYAFKNVESLEKGMPGFRKPWNFSFMMTGDFTIEEDPYFDFSEALIRWGVSFAALGLNFKGGSLQLDLLDRKGKHNNGFCHYPKVVNFNNGRRNPGAANFTCNVVYGQPGTGYMGIYTLFHEGGHAVDGLCREETEVCLNTEYPPASIAWAETHSQFLDTMFSSIEWQARYAKDKSGSPYPFDLFERKVKQTAVLAPTSLNMIIAVSEFEKRIYEDNNLTAEKAIEIAKSVSRKYTHFSEDTLWILSLPHIYSWESSAYYHSYGLSQLALHQWRQYFYDKYGYIVDNPNVGKELMRVWEFGSVKSFPEFVKLATRRDFSPEAFLEDATMDIEGRINRAKQRMEITRKVPEYSGPVELDAYIRMVHGTEIIADNSISFEDMAAKYGKWLEGQRQA